PESVYMCFQMTFAIITPALICGAFADRMKFSALLWFIGLWSVLVYAPIAHWVWGPGGFLNDAGILDFAGGTVVHINSGVAGLMASTPASGCVDRRGALIIGIAAGVICYWGVTGLKKTFGYDDSLDAFGVHGVGGTVGAILTGVLAVAAVGGDGKSGLIDGNPHQVVIQLYGVAVTVVYDAIVSLILLKAIDVVLGLRVDVDTEREGLDLAIHGEVIQ